MGPRRHLQAAVQTLSANESPVRPSTPSAHAAGARPAEAERRQLTVLFCDLVGSTALSARLDPEEMGRCFATIKTRVLASGDALRRACREVHGGRRLGLFRLPQAHEDDAERAVRAGLDWPRRSVGCHGRGRPIAARVGIATGPVVVGELIGEGASQEETVVGETPNLAARLQALPRPAAS